MDNRLKDIQQGTLTESRLNSDFLYWLKTQGPNYLLLAMLVLCGFMGFHWWENRVLQATDSAWVELLAAQTPLELIEVANKNTGTDAISQLATLNAADSYMRSVQGNKRFDREAGAADSALTPELRVEYLAEADRLYAKVASEGAHSNGSSSLTAIAALFGRAAVAETRNEPKQAAEFLDQAGAIASKTYPQLAKIASSRSQSLPQLNMIRDMPSRPVDPNAPADPAASSQSALVPSNPPLSITPIESPAQSAPVVDPAAPASPK